MTKTDIANLALSLIGGSTITTIDDPTAQARACKKWFDTARDEALASHPWNFAIKRLSLKPAWQHDIDTITNASGVCRVGHDDHGLQTGDRVQVRGVQGVPGANGMWEISRVDDDRFDLIGSTFTGSYIPSTGEWVKLPPFSWDYFFPLPSDCLRVCNINGLEGGEEDSTPYAVESGNILANEERLNLLYVTRVAEPTTWPADFCNAFALLLASYIAQELMGPTGRALELRQQYESMIMPKVKGRDARQGKGHRLPLSHDSDVVRARRGAGYETA